MGTFEEPQAYEERARRQRDNWTLRAIAYEAAFRETLAVSHSVKLFDKAEFHTIAQIVEAEWKMGGLVSTIYEDFARECCERYLSSNDGRVINKTGGEDGHQRL